MSSGATKKKCSVYDIFNILSDEEDTVSVCAAQKQQLTSSLLNKVATGAVRRVAELCGDYYIELRVYPTRDVVAVKSEERWKKALLTLKAQVNTDSPEWNDLQKFIRSAKEMFSDSEPIFYSNKINIH